MNINLVRKSDGFPFSLPSGAGMNNSRESKKSGLNQVRSEGITLSISAEA